MTMTDEITQAWEFRAIDPLVVSQLRERDDAGAAPRISIDATGGSPLRCCLRRSAPGERIALVSYAPLRRWARQTGADPGPYDEVGPVFIHPQECGGPAGGGQEGGGSAGGGQEGGGSAGGGQEGGGSAGRGQEGGGSAGGGQAGDAYPEAFLGSRRVLRSYAAGGHILGGRLVEPEEIGDQAAAGRVLAQIFADPEVALVHARAVDYGCFTFEVRRAARRSEQ